MTQASTQSAQSYAHDPRNDHVEVYVNGAFFPRNEASVSVFDAGFVLGDGVWEGLRLVKGRLVKGGGRSRVVVARSLLPAQATSGQHDSFMTSG